MIWSMLPLIFSQLPKLEQPAPKRFVSMLRDYGVWKKTKKLNMCRIHICFRKLLRVEFLRTWKNKLLYLMYYMTRQLLTCDKRKKKYIGPKAAKFLRTINAVRKVMLLIKYVKLVNPYGLH